MSSTPLLSPELLVGSKTSLQPPAVLTHHPGGFISVYSKPTSCEQTSKSPHPLLPGLVRASLLPRAFLVALPGSFCPKLAASNRARNPSQHWVPSSPSFPSTELKRTLREFLLLSCTAGRQLPKKSAPKYYSKNEYFRIWKWRSSETRLLRVDTRAAI